MDSVSPPPLPDPIDKSQHRLRNTIDTVFEEGLFKSCAYDVSPEAKRDELRDFGISRVITITDSPRQKHQKLEGIDYFFFKKDDFLSQDLLHNVIIPEALQLIEVGLGAWRRVLVHCAAATTHKDLLIAAYMVKTNRWTRQKAIQSLAGNPNDCFQRQLIEYFEKEMTLFKPLQPRKQLFCTDIINESIRFLGLHDLLRAIEMNRRVLGASQRELDRLKPPRTVGPLRIDLFGVYRECGLDERGRMILELLPFPQVPPPSEDKILGFGRVTIVLRNRYFGTSNSKPGFLERLTKFFLLCEKLLRQHDLLLEGSQWDQRVVGVLTEQIFSKLTGKDRVVELDISSVGVRGKLLRSQALLSTTRLLFTAFRDLSHTLEPKHFQKIVDWIHSPATSEGAAPPRSMIICLCHLVTGCVNNFIPMIVERFKCVERKGEQCKFCVLVLVPHIAPRPFRLTNWERGDTLSLEPIHEGRDRFGRPLSELLFMDPGVESQFGGRSQAFEYFLRRAFFLNRRSYIDPETYFTENLSGYILRRDVAVGPWTRPELYEARRPHQFPEQHKLLHFEWSWT